MLFSPLKIWNNTSVRHLEGKWTNHGPTTEFYARENIWTSMYQYGKWKVWVAQSCLTPCDPRDCSSPGSLVHGIFQARILEWVAIFFSRVFSQPRDRTQVSCIAGRFLTVWATREAPVREDHYNFMSLKLNIYVIWTVPSCRKLFP